MNAPAKRRVLLVDDEPRIVDGLQRALRPQRAVWEVSAAGSGQAALELLATRSFDVIVTDMRMPEMDGAALLAIVKERYPAPMRIVLSGQTDVEAALRAVPVAHQFLSKPTDPTVLLELLARMALTKDAITDARVHAAIGQVDSLPSLPALCGELTDLMSAEDTSTADIARLFEQDSALVLKLLQVVNSAFFGLRRRMLNMTEAVGYLGIELVKSLVLSMSIVNVMPVRAARFDSKAFSDHALAVGQMARHIGEGRPVADIAFVAGMLHDVGKLALAFAMPEVFDDLAKCVDETGCSFEEAEAAAGTCGHAKIGAYLLDLWGLPYTVVETLVALPPSPTREGSELGGADAVRLAHLLLDPRAASLIEDPERHLELASFGLLERLPTLMTIAREMRGTR